MWGICGHQTSRTSVVGWVGRDGGWEEHPKEPLGCQLSEAGRSLDGWRVLMGKAVVEGKSFVEIVDVVVVGEMKGSRCQKLFGILKCSGTDCPLLMCKS